MAKEKKDPRKRRSGANLNAGPTWWKRFSLPRRGVKQSLLAPASFTAALLSSLTRRILRRRARLRTAVEAPRVTRAKHICVADWDGDVGMARVEVVRGNAVASMGVWEGGVQWIFPEEAVYLVDRGQLDLRVGGVPVSLQRAHVLMTEGPWRLPMEEYLAFCHLRRMGYVVRRFGIDLGSEDGGENANGGVEVSAERQGNRGGSSEGGEEKLRPQFSVWRSGAFRRKEVVRPIFHLVVWRYEDSPPSVEGFAELLQSCDHKTRLRGILIDRGVVIVVDLANNATPLSARFVDRVKGRN